MLKQFYRQQNDKIDTNSRIPFLVHLSSPSSRHDSRDRTKCGYKRTLIHLCGVAKQTSLVSSGSCNLSTLHAAHSSALVSTLHWHSLQSAYLHNSTLYKATHQRRCVHAGQGELTQWVLLTGIWTQWVLLTGISPVLTLSTGFSWLSTG